MIPMMLLRPEKRKFGNKDKLSWVKHRLSIYSYRCSGYSSLHFYLAAMSTVSLLCLYFPRLHPAGNVTHLMFISGLNAPVKIGLREI